MKTILATALAIPVVLLTACQSPGGAGTVGATGFQSGTDREEGSTPFAIGRASEFQRAGLANVNMAATRAEAVMDVSGSGSGELSRRSAAATIRGAGPARGRERPILDELESAPAALGGDEILLARVQQALGSPSAGGPDTQPLSIQTLSNLRISVLNGLVILGGRVPDNAQSQQIEKLVRGVRGVRDVSNEMRFLDPPPSVPGP